MSVVADDVPISPDRQEPLDSGHIGSGRLLTLGHQLLDQLRLGFFLVFHGGELYGFSRSTPRSKLEDRSNSLVQAEGVG